MKFRNIIIAILVVALLIAAGWAYWYFLMGPVKTETTTVPTTTQPGFKPISRPGTPGSTTSTGTNSTSSMSANYPAAKLPVLRLLSDTPVGGYGASTTAATTTVRWIDRGRGNIYEANYRTSETRTISNTVVPRMVMSSWNKNLTAFIGSMFEDGDETLTTVYAQLIPQKAASSTSSQIAPFELRGKNIAGKLVGYAISPNKAQVFMFMDESGTGVGYIASFDGKNMAKLFSTPLTQVNVDWPTDNAITVTTKGSASYNGFMYFVSPKTGKWTKIIGPVIGLSAVASHDGKYIAYSGTGRNNSVITSVYSVAAGTTTDAVIRTLADKCAWGNTIKDILYCAVPSQLTSGTYPDDWYRGTLSTVDKIWQVSASTGEAHLLSSLIDQADRAINGFNLGLDPKDNYLFFMNKNDLSLWSLDLVRTK